MNERLRAIIAEILEVHWKPSTDLPVVAVSWLLVVGGLYTATFVVGQEAWGGAVVQISGTLASAQIPPLDAFLPLAALALCIGFFEAIFWRGWVQLRLEESFGILPGLLLGSALYAAYHIGYGMSLNEMGFLFFIGLMYGAAFRLTRSVFVLWPLFQPSGQLVTLVKDGLQLPLLASLGFIEALALMVVLV